MELDDTASILASVDFFSICDAEQQRLLAFASERQHYRAGQTLFLQGDVGDGAYIVHRGSALIDDDPDRPNDSYKINGPSVLLGEMSLVLDRPRRTSVTAITDIDALFVPRQAFTKLMHQYPEMAARAAKQIEAELSAYLHALDRFRHTGG